MKSRLLVAAVGIPLILYVILFAPFAVLELMLVILSGIGAYELMKCIHASAQWRQTAAQGAAFIVFCQCFINAQFTMPVVLLFVIAFFAVAVWKGGEVKWLELSTSIFAVVVIPYAFTAFLRLNEYGYHRAFLLLPLIFSFASDTGAFFAGRSFGKHKLAPKVSPNKTVEGAIGGLAGNAIGGIVFAFVMNQWLGQSINYLMMAILGVLCSIVAQLGDLSFSLIKREFGIKDYGNLFLAHGGVLDRFDSVLFVAPVLTMVVPWLL